MPIKNFQELENLFGGLDSPHAQFLQEMAAQAHPERSAPKRGRARIPIQSQPEDMALADEAQPSYPGLEALRGSPDLQRLLADIGPDVDPQYAREILLQRLKQQSTDAASE